MIALEVEVPYANFRKSFARSYAETYTLPPPATLYGMLLSLVGERQRRSHLGVKLAVGFLRKPKLTTVLKKLSRYKYGVPSKQAKLGNAPDYMEVVCGLEFTVWVDSAVEGREPTLESWIRAAIDTPEVIDRTGILCLGLSDDLVGDVRRLTPGQTRSVEWLVPDPRGAIDLPVWVDHVGSADTRWRRFRLEPGSPDVPPPEAWLTMIGPGVLNGE
jgi:CRISPR-associated protein Cas5t